MAIAVANSTSNVFSFNQTVTLSAFDCSGADTLLMVQIGSNRAAAPPFLTPTFNGVALTLLSTPGPCPGVGSGDHRIWYAIGPSGAHDIVCTLNAAGTRGVCAAVLLTGVNQVTPFGTPVISTANGVTTFTESAVTSAAGELVVDFVLNLNQSPTQDASQTLIFQSSIDSDCQSEVSTKPGAASVTMQWTTGVVEFYSAMAVSLKASGGGGGGGGGTPGNAATGLVFGSGF
jgi:hypothetical protein